MMHGEIFLRNNLGKFLKGGGPPVFEDILSLPLILVLHDSVEIVKPIIDVIIERSSYSYAFI